MQDEHKKTAQQAMEIAQKNGCQACRVGIFTANNYTIEMRDMKIEQLSQATESRMKIELMVDKKYGAFSTNRMNGEEIKTLIINGIDAVKYLEQDPFRQLPDPHRYFKGPATDLQQFDPTFAQLTTTDKKRLVEQNMAEIFGTHPQIISVSGSYSDGFGNDYLIDSNGFEGESQSSWCSLGTEVSLQGKGDARPEEAWYESSLIFNDLIKTGIGKKTLERGLKKINHQKIPSGKYVMIVENIVAARLLSPLISAMNGSALQQKNSFLIDRLHQKIAANCLTLTDEPHIPKSFGARWFDDEGVATQHRTVIENGVLQMYYIDTYNSLKMNISPTIATPSQLIVAPGNRSLTDIQHDQERAIFVTGFNGGNCNPTTGDFSLGIEGFYLEHGTIQHPLSEMNITGNMLQLWQQLIEVGNDPQINTARRIPTLVFEEVSFNGM